MSGFAGFVNYTANFLFDLPRVTGRLWEMAGMIGGGVKHGIDVVEENGAFVKNSFVPLKSSDYYRKAGINACYLFSKGSADKPLCGAFFLPREKTLYLFRLSGGEPVYYEELDGYGLVFGTTPRVFELFEKHTEHSELDEGKIVVYDVQGLTVQPFY